MKMADETDKKRDADGQSPPEQVTLPREEVEALRAAEAKAAEYLDLAKRTQAEFINYQARVRREREDLAKYALEKFLRDILPVLDGMSHLLQAPADSGAPAVLDGVRIVEREMLRLLAKSGVRPMETVGKRFDPLFHEAVATVDPPPGTQDATVVEELRRGFMIHDRVLRPAQVKVARPATEGKAAPPPPPDPGRQA
jgi:molecular chaperone GrpE